MSNNTLAAGDEKLVFTGMASMFSSHVNSNCVMDVPVLLVSYAKLCPADEYKWHRQDLRKRLDVERNQKEQFARQLTAVKEEVTAAQHSAQEDAAAAQQQVCFPTLYSPDRVAGKHHVMRGCC